LIGAFVLLISNAGAAQALPPKSTTIHFLKGIEVRINHGEPMLFGLDTGGAVDFFITPKRADSLGLPVIGQHSIRTSDKAQEAGAAAKMVRANTLTVAGHSFTMPEGLVLPDAEHDGTLGITLFRDVLLTLDYPKDQLTVASGALARGEADVMEYITHPEANFRPLQYSPSVKIKLAGREIEALLDTGARKVNADVIVPKAIARTLPLGPVETETTLQDAAGRNYPSYTAKLQGDLVLGGVVIEKPVVLVSDWLGFVDLARICNRLEITIDQRNHLLRLRMSESGSGAR
jgi:predicted aspartyl protease